MRPRPAHCRTNLTGSCNVRAPPRPRRRSAEGVFLHGGESRLGQEPDREISGRPRRLRGAAGAVAGAGAGRRLAAAEGDRMRRRSAGHGEDPRARGRDLLHHVPAPAGRPQGPCAGCGTTPCLLRGGEEIEASASDASITKPFHVSADGDFSWEEVECLGACVNAPMVLIGSDTYEDLTRGNLREGARWLGRGETPKPGPQNGRQILGADRWRHDAHGLADHRCAANPRSAGRRTNPAEPITAEPAESRNARVGCRARRPIRRLGCPP